MSQKRLKKLRKVDKEVEVIEVEKIEKHSIIQILKENWVFMVMLSIGIFLLYLNGIKGDFVSDDYATLINNPLVKVLSSYKGNLTPVTFANYLLAVLFGVTPLVYHSFSVLFYILTCWVFIVFLNFIVKKDLARLTMLLFAVLPIHVEAVNWISGKPYLYIGLFVMFSLIAFIKYLEDDKLQYLFLSALSFALIFIADKPRPFSLFLLIPLYLVYVNKKLYWNKMKKMMPYIILAAIVFLIFGFKMIINRVNIVNGGYNASESIFYNPFFQYPTGIPKYLQLLLFPVDLTLYHTMYVLPTWLNWLIFLNFFALIIYFFKRDKRIFFGLTFFIATLLPSMAPIKVSWLVAERYAFLPSLGFCIFLAVVLESIIIKSKFLGNFILFTIVILFGYKVYLRNIDWNTNHNLWVNTCQVSPNSHNAWNNIGDDYDKQKDYENAVKGFSQSTLVKPNYADAYHNRANIFFKVGRLDLARESYDTALRFSPSLYQTYLSLTQIDLNEKKYDLALSHAAKSVEIQPSDPQAMFVYGLVKAEMGAVEEARNIFKQILVAFPDYQAARNALIQMEAVKIGSSKLIK